MRKINKKGQLSLQDAPMVVLTVGFLFLMMATIALVGEKYQSAFTTTSKTVNNETLAVLNDSVALRISQAGACNFGGFAVTQMCNATGSGGGIDCINTANYTVNPTTGRITYVGEDTWNNTVYNVTYSFDYSGVACNVTTDLNTEISNNTSIAGIVLTIALIGIVLSVLIGIFVLAKGRRRI